MKQFDAQQPIVDKLIADRHKATANAFADIRTEFTKTYNGFFTEISGYYQKVGKAELRAISDQLDSRIESLKDPKPLVDWDPSPRHEIALRIEVGAKVKRINHTCEDLMLLMPSKIALIVHSCDIDLLEDFTAAINEWVTMNREPWHKKFAELDAFMHRLLILDTKMLELKKVIKSHH